MYIYVYGKENLLVFITFFLARYHYRIVLKNIQIEALHRKLREN